LWCGTGRKGGGTLQIGLLKLRGKKKREGEKGTLRWPLRQPTRCKAGKEKKGERGLGYLLHPITKKERGGEGERLALARVELFLDIQGGKKKEGEEDEASVVRRREEKKKRGKKGGKRDNQSPFDGLEKKGDKRAAH